MRHVVLSSGVQVDLFPFLFRFILQAKELGKRIAVVNIGPTRADHLVDLKVEARASDVLAKINYSLYS